MGHFMSIRLNDFDKSKLEDSRFCCCWGCSKQAIRSLGFPIRITTLRLEARRSFHEFKVQGLLPNRVRLRLRSGCDTCPERETTEVFARSPVNLEHQHLLKFAHENRMASAAKQILAACAFFQGASSETFITSSCSHIKCLHIKALCADAGM